MEIYKTTNLINGKIYIGQSKHENPNYYGSGRILLKALKKYGKQNFKKETLCSKITSFELLDELEKHYIQLYASYIRGYNIDKGGKGNKPEQNSKISLNGTKGRKRPSSEMIGISLHNKSRVVTKETREKIGLKSIGNSYRKNIPHLEESKKKMSIKQAERYITNPDLRKHLSEKIKEIKPYLSSQIPIIILNVETNETIKFNSIKDTSTFFGIKNAKGFIKCLKNDLLYRSKYKITKLKNLR